MKVLIAAPLRQAPKIFVEYQKGLDSLIIPDGVQVDRYFVVNNCDEVIPYIRDAEYDVVNTENAMMYQDHLWTGELISGMTVYRNMNGWSNAWMYDQVSENNLPEWKTPGLYRVGGTGALFLIKRKVLEAGVDYTPIPNLRKAVFGEDRHFCIRAVCHGFEIWADNRCQPVHLYRNKHYDDYIGGRAKPCFRK